MCDTQTPEVVAEYIWTCCKAADSAAIRRESEKENPLLQCFGRTKGIDIV